MPLFSPIGSTFCAVKNTGGTLPSQYLKRKTVNQNMQLNRRKHTISKPYVPANIPSTLCVASDFPYNLWLDGVQPGLLRGSPAVSLHVNFFEYFFAATLLVHIQISVLCS